MTAATHVMPNELFIGLLVTALLTISTLVLNIVMIVKNLRRQPPTNEVLQDFKVEIAKQVAAMELAAAKAYATKKEMNQISKDRSANTRDLHDKIDKLTSSVQTTFNTLQRNIGQIEGRIEVLEPAK
jgi:uncharacterized protein involved in exopolysaccharide biosynthesis